MPSIVQGLGRLWGSADFELDWDTSLFTTGDILLLIVLCVVLIPLGFAKRIDFLGFTSAIGMFAMMSFGKSERKIGVEPSRAVIFIKLKVGGLFSQKYEPNYIA